MPESSNLIYDSLPAGGKLSERFRPDLEGLFQLTHFVLNLLLEAVSSFFYELDFLLDLLSYPAKMILKMIFQETNLFSELVLDVAKVCSDFLFWLLSVSRSVQSRLHFSLDLLRTFLDLSRCRVNPCLYFDQDLLTRGLNLTSLRLDFFRQGLHLFLQPNWTFLICLRSAVDRVLVRCLSAGWRGCLCQTQVPLSWEKRGKGDPKNQSEDLAALTSLIQ